MRVLHLASVDQAYLVEIPPDLPRVLGTWAEVQEALKGSGRARQMKVRSSNPATSAREHAQAIINGDGVVLEPGRRYAFTDANAKGGIGIVIVDEGHDGIAMSSEWPPTNVYEVFERSKITGLASREQIAQALADQRNILAEMAALFAAVRTQPRQSELTVVYDYWGVEKWMQGSEWKEAKDPVTAAVVRACKDVIAQRGLAVGFRYQVAHQSTIIGRDDFASWNGRADALATQASEVLVK